MALVGLLVAAPSLGGEDRDAAADSTRSPAPVASALPGDPAAGRRTFNRNCRVCHQVESGAASAIGPNLAGIVGRSAPIDAAFEYSAAFRAASSKGLVWDPATLDRFLVAPARMIPGSQMPLAVSDPTQRRDLVAYLATLAP